MGVVAAIIGGWTALVGVAGGAAAMAGALEVSALRTRALLSGGDRGFGIRVVLARAGWLVATLAVFGVLLEIVHVPGWSVAVGVTACVAGLVVGFLAKRPEEEEPG